MVYWKTEHKWHGEDEKDEMDHASNEKQERNNAHYMSDDDRNAFDVLARFTLTT